MIILKIKVSSRQPGELQSSQFSNPEKGPKSEQTTPTRYQKYVYRPIMCYGKFVGVSVWLSVTHVHC